MQKKIIFNSHFQTWFQNLCPATEWEVLQPCPAPGNPGRTQRSPVANGFYFPPFFLLPKAVLLCSRGSVSGLYWPGEWPCWIDVAALNASLWYGFPKALASVLWWCQQNWALRGAVEAFWKRREKSFGPGSTGGWGAETLQAPENAPEMCTPGRNPIIAPHLSVCAQGKWSLTFRGVWITNKYK